MINCEWTTTGDRCKNKAVKFFIVIKSGPYIYSFHENEITAFCDKCYKALKKDFETRYTEKAEEITEEKFIYLHSII